MTIPKLKRIKVSSERELRAWLSKNAAAQDVMIVTCNERSRTQHISSAQVRSVLGETGWKTGRSYTLDGNLLGHVASHG